MTEGVSPIQVPAETETSAETRLRLTRERVLTAAVALADEGGIGSISMRKLAEELGVEAMSLYNHIGNKEDLLDGMVDLVLGEIDMTPSDADWASALRQRAMSARAVVLRHGWATNVIESRTSMTPTMLSYMDSSIGILRAGGLSVELIHHAMHAIGSRMLGFTQTLFDTEDVGPEAAAIMMQHGPTVEQYPNLALLLMAVDQDGASLLGEGCDAELEFEFGLNLILDGLERLRKAG